MAKLSHIDEQGRANMVDVSQKASTQRTAVAESQVLMAPETLAAIRSHSIGKGEVIATARIAGIQAAKRCADLIPLCHPLALTKVTVEISEVPPDRLVITAECRVTGPTGVEMEALTAASVAALTVYDMCKAIDRGMSVEHVRLVSKQGGKSGDWQR